MSSKSTTDQEKVPRKRKPRKPRTWTVTIEYVPFESEEQRERSYELWVKSLEGVTISNLPSPRQIESK